MDNTNLVKLIAGLETTLPRLPKILEDHCRLLDENADLKRKVEALEAENNRLTTLLTIGDADGDVDIHAIDVYMDNIRVTAEKINLQRFVNYCKVYFDDMPSEWQGDDLFPPRDVYGQEWLDAMSEKYNWEPSQLEDTDFINAMYDEESFAADILVKNWEAFDQQAYELVTGESIGTEGWTDLYESIPEHRKEKLGEAALFDVAYFDAMKRVQARRERLHAAGLTNWEVWADAECIRLEDLYSLYYELEKQAK